MTDIIDIYPDNFIKGLRTEELEFKIECCEYATPIYLRWKNDLGGIDYWLFDKQNSYSPDVKTINMYERPLQDIKTGDKLRVTEKEYKKQWICNTDFERENAEGMKQLLKSECVEYYDENEEFVKVDVELANWSLINDRAFGKMSIKIIFARDER